MRRSFLDSVLRGAEALAARDGVGTLPDPDRRVWPGPISEFEMVAEFPEAQLKGSVLGFHLNREEVVFRVHYSPGNPRYLIPAVAALMAAAAVAVRPAWLAVAMAAGVAAFNLADVRDVRDDLVHRERVRENLEAPAVPERCRPVRTATTERAIAARVLDQPIPQENTRSELVLSGEAWSLRC